MLTVYSKNNCPYCVNAKNYLTQNNIAFEEINIEQQPEARTMLMESGHRTLPQIYQGNKLFVEGGWQGLSKLTAEQILTRLSTYQQEQQ
jgi:glutaredoxin